MLVIIHEAPPPELAHRALPERCTGEHGIGGCGQVVGWLIQPEPPGLRWSYVMRLAIGAQSADIRGPRWLECAGCTIVRLAISKMQSERSDAP